jgi:predicted permease
MPWWRRRRDEELDAELRTHLEMAARDRLERGEAPGAAERAARREFGNVLQVKEITREMWGRGSLERLRQDLVYGLRLMRRNPGFTATAVLSLALGVGANTAMFTVIDAVLLRPLPYRQPDRLVMVYSVGSFGPFSWNDGPFFDPEYLEFRKVAAFSDVAAISGGQVSLNDAGEPAHVQRSQVTASLFPLLGVQAVLGRVFNDEEQSSGAPVVVLGDAIWRSRYHADLGVVGRMVKVEGVPHTIIGVMPEGFSFPTKAEIWAPLALRPSYRDNAFNQVVGRLAPGVTREQARSELEALLRSVGKNVAPGQRTERTSIVDLRESMVGKVRWLLLVLMGAVGCVILIACTNVANLLMARAGGRGREMSVRAALGAGRTRLLRQLLTESVMLALCGGCLGLLLSTIALPVLLSWVPTDMLPRAGEVRLNPTVVGFTFVLGIATGLTFGVLPAVSASRTDAAQFHQLRSARGTTLGERRFRGLLIVVDTALVLVLLIGAGLLLKSFWNLQHVDPGFRPEGLLTMTVSLPERTYRTIDQKRAFYASLLERLQALPLVGDPAAVNLMPFGLMGWAGDFEVEGRETAPVNVVVAKPAVSEGYFRTIGIPLTEGRFFQPGDRDGAPLVAIVSESVARACWPDRSAIGRRITMDDQSKRRWLTVVGVVGDVHQDSLESKPMPAIYVPIAQEAREFFLTSMTYVLRPRAGLDGVATGLRQEVRALDSELPIQRLARFDRILATSVAEPRFRTGVLIAFALLALILALVGIYGLVSYEVVRRTAEVGIRRALGARNRDVLRLVVGRIATLVTVGLAAGIIVAGLVTRTLEAFLFGVQPLDAATFLLVPAGLGAVALLATWLPARRALFVDPIAALRHE